MLMRTIFLAMIGFLAFLPINAWAETSGEDIRKAATDFLQQWVRQESGEGYRVEFEVGHIDSRLALADCKEPLQTSFTGDPLETTRPSVLVSCAGDRPWRMYVTASMEVFGPALVASRALARGERLSAALVETQSVQVNASRKGVLKNPEDVAGMMMARPVQAGTVITPDLLEAPIAVERGDHVIIVARSKNFSISSRGVAQNSGAIGEQVTVENLSSARRVRGTVVAKGRVEIPM